MKKSAIVLAVIFLVLFIDQCLKIWVKTHMNYGDEIKIFGLDWALIHFVENNGMAFGISLGGIYGKLALSLFRIVAVGFLIYYLRLLLRSGVSTGLLVSFALILAGALGNILDSAFYGLIFSESPYHGGLAELFPEGGGYSSLLHGKVVDMLYFPIIDTYLPEWVPYWGGTHFMFFKPVFNIADLSITLGVLNILLFQRSFFSALPESEKEDASNEEGAPEESKTEADGPADGLGAAEGEPGMEEDTTDTVYRESHGAQDVPGEEGVQGRPE
ncbi:MAG: lipoprotein signal peptidase [Lewinellaceae bacterium]|nr:lipoprotein signal peptidase [Lewinellaceae bacterium]